jgi:hypothetical protein
MMQKTRWILLLGVAPILAPDPCRTQVLRGFVLDAENEVLVGEVGRLAPIGGAEVEILAVGSGERESISTDSLGLFNYPAPAPGVFEIRATHPAYNPSEWERVEVGEEEIVSLEIRLGRNVIPLDPLVVVARTNTLMAGFHERRSGGAFATFLTREEIEARGAARASDLLRGLPGIRLQFVRWGEGPAIEMQGGFGTCEPAIFVDGVQVPRTSGIGTSLDDYITPERIEGMEVYSSFSTVPVQYHSGMCGVILLWTRRGGREGGEPWSWKRVLLGFGAAVGLLVWIL